MELNGSLYFQSDRDALWAAIFSPTVWKATLPDAEKYEQTGEGQFEAIVKVDVGPIKGSQSIEIIYTDMNRPESCNFELKNGLIKKASGNFVLHQVADYVPPVPAEGEEAQPIPEGSQTVLTYGLDLDAGNPFFNAALEGFKGKLKDGFEELLTELEAKGRELRGQY